MSNAPLLDESDLSPRKLKERQANSLGALIEHVNQEIPLPEPIFTKLSAECRSMEVLEDGRILTTDNQC